MAPSAHPARMDAGHGHAMPHTGQQQPSHGSFHAGAPSAILHHPCTAELSHGQEHRACHPASCSVDAQRCTCAGTHGDRGPSGASQRDSPDRHRHPQDAGSHGHDGAQHGGGMLQHVLHGGGMLGGKPSWLAVRDRHAGSMRLAGEQGPHGKSMGGKQARLAK